MISEYSLNNREEWDSIVKSFQYYDVYYLSGYSDAFQAHGDGEPILLYYSDSSSELRGINVVMKRDVAMEGSLLNKLQKNKLFDLSTPYGYGGWILEGNISNGDQFKRFLSSYLSWANDLGIVSEFVRFHPLINNGEYEWEGFYDIVNLGNTVSIKLDDEEAIWNRFTSKNRGHIRKAIKEGVFVEISQSKESFDIFRSIYESTMKHDNAGKYYYFNEEFFDRLRNGLSDNCYVFTAYLKEAAIASAIMLFSNKYMHYHLSGQLFEYRRFAGTNLILYEAAKWGCVNGYRELHLGGGLGAGDDALYTFKKSFNPKLPDANFMIGKKIFDKKQYEMLVSLTNKNPTGFFPQYRA